MPSHVMRAQHANARVCGTGRPCGWRGSSDASTDAAAVAGCSERPSHGREHAQCICAAVWQALSHKLRRAVQRVCRAMLRLHGVLRASAVIVRARI